MGVGEQSSVVEPFGEAEGRVVERVYLESSTGLCAAVSTYGATLLGLWGADGHNAVLGFDTLGEYLKDPHYLGVTVGRVANRIARGRFEFGGRVVQLPLNDEPDHHHGGAAGFSRRVWELGEVTATAATFRLHAPDGDGGYPGALDASVTYAIDGASLMVTMAATAQDDTLVNLVNHAYFNLEDAGDVLAHELELAASLYTPVNERVPDGTVRPVEGTDLDFRTRTRIGARLPSGGSPGAPPGYDHNFLLEGADRYQAASSGEAPVRHVATLSAPRSRRTLAIASNQPAVQLYTANFFDGRGASTRGRLERHQAICIETQAPPNAINVPAWQQMVLLPRGASYRHVVSFTLGSE